MRSAPRRGAAEWLIASGGVWHIGLGLYFIFVRPALLPEDIRYIGADVKALLTVAPHLGDWLSKVFTVMGGFMAGAGVLIAYLGWQILPSRPRWATFVLLLVGALTLLLMSAVNFALHTDFRWLLAAPPVAWFAAVWAYVYSDRRSGVHTKACGSALAPAPHGATLDSASPRCRLNGQPCEGRSRDGWLPEHAGFADEVHGGVELSCLTFERSRRTRFFVLFSYHQEKST